MLESNLLTIKDITTIFKLQVIEEEVDFRTNLEIRGGFNRKESIKIGTNRDQDQDLIAKLQATNTIHKKSRDEVALINDIIFIRIMFAHILSHI